MKYYLFLALAFWCISANAATNAYVCKDKSKANGSFYDCGAASISFVSQPAADDLVCASSNKPGPWNQTLGRPGNFLPFASIADPMSVCVCNSATCKAGDNIESYALKSIFASGTSPPADPVPTPPPGPITTPGVGKFTVTWPPTLLGTKGEDVSGDIIGYCVYYGLSVGSLTNQFCVGNVLTAVVTGLPAGFYYLQMTAKTATEESNRTSVGSVAVTAASTPTPVDCVLSAWSQWSSTEQWSACDKGSQARTEQRSRTIVTPPANGGAACGPLSESRVATQACVVSAPPSSTELCLVDGIAAGTRPIYAPSATGTRGAKVSDLIVGPASQPAGTVNPVRSPECSCIDLKNWSSTVYAKVQGGYVAGCKSYGNR